MLEKISTVQQNSDIRNNVLFDIPYGKLPSDVSNYMKMNNDGCPKIIVLILILIITITINVSIESICIYICIQYEATSHHTTSKKQLSLKIISDSATV